MNDVLGRYNKIRFVRGSVEKAIFGLYSTFIAKHAIDKNKHMVMIPEATYAPWKSNPEFDPIYEQVRGNTLVEKSKLFELWSLIRQVSHLEGDCIEVGVWRGGSGCLMAHTLQSSGDDAQVYLCDTFEGMVKTSDNDPHYKGGELSDTSEDIVRKLATKMGLKNVHILKGIFPEDTGDQVEGRKFKIVHVDVDVYDSARDVVNHVWDRLVPGGLIVFDDYGYAATEGVTKFVDEYVKDRKDCLFIYNSVGHGIIVKREVSLH